MTNEELRKEVNFIETGIPCLECGERSGIDCVGRTAGEATRCAICFEKFMEKEVEIAALRIKKLESQSQSSQSSANGSSGETV